MAKLSSSQKIDNINENKNCSFDGLQKLCLIIRDPNPGLQLLSQQADPVKKDFKPFSLYALDSETFLPVGASPKSQRDHRSLAFQFIYALERSNFSISLGELIEMYKADYGLILEKDSFSYKIADGVLLQFDSLHKQINPFLDDSWPLDRLSCTVNLLLIMAFWELQNSETPHQIIIDEYVELAKAYGEKDAFKIVNAVLDNFVKKSKGDQ